MKLSHIQPDLATKVPHHVVAVALAAFFYCYKQTFQTKMRQEFNGLEEEKKLHESVASK